MLCLLLPLTAFSCKAEERVPDVQTPEPPSVPENGVYTVGEHIAKEAVTDFYYTVATTTFPPFYQRFRFYVEDGAYRFFREIREGDHFPLTEEDAVISETIPLSGEQWNTFLDCIAGGTVIARQEHLESGDDGPWLYLYWTGDPGDVQEFSFASVNARFAFETLCETLSSAE